jgi:hypothetical protein
MASVTVDVSLDDFDLDELLEEIEDRYNYNNNKAEIEKWAKDFFEFDGNTFNLSIIDQQKIDFVMKNLQKISLQDLENLI